MRALFDIKVILLIGLFAALVIKGGQICAAGGGQTVTRQVASAPAPAPEPLPVRPIEEEFRGVSPLPALAERPGHVRKTPRPAASRKLSKAPLPSRSAAAKPAAQPKPSKLAKN